MAQPSSVASNASASASAKVNASKLKALSEEMSQRIASQLQTVTVTVDAKEFPRVLRTCHLRSPLLLSSRLVDSPVPMLWILPHSSAVPCPCAN
jgi:hypothetical protein